MRCEVPRADVRGKSTGERLIGDALTDGSRMLNASGGVPQYHRAGAAQRVSMRFTAVDSTRRGRDCGTGESATRALSIGDDHMTAPTYQGTNSFWP